MAEVTIEATPNGPYLVTGPIELRDADGKVLPTKRARSGSAAAAHRQRSRSATAPTPRSAFRPLRRPCLGRPRGLTVGGIPIAAHLLEQTGRKCSGAARRSAFGPKAAARCEDA